MFNTQSGERGEVKSETVNQRRETIPEVCHGYEPTDIFNMGESPNRE